MNTTRNAALAAILATLAGTGMATELLSNGGFESGSSGWTFSAGSGAAGTTTDEAHGGSLAALLDGYDSSLSQTFAATEVSTISEFSLYALSSAGAYDQIVFSYADGSSSTAVLFGLGDSGWTQYDLTSELLAGQSLVGITIYGASGQLNYIDDVVLNTAVATVPEPGSAALSLLGLAGGLAWRRRQRVQPNRPGACAGSTASSL